MQNQLQKLNSANPSLTIGSEISQATKTLKLSDCSNPQIKAILSKIYLLIGLRPESFPSAEMEALCIHYIREAFGHYGSKELMLAFELAVFERLDVDISHYDSFSVAYVSKIINAYRKKKNEVFSQPTEEKALPILPPAQMSKDEMKAELESYREKKLGLEILPVYLYDYMKELGHQVEINQDILWRACMIRKNFLYCQVENDIERKKEYGEFNRMLESGEIVGPEKLIIHNLAKRIIIFDFLNDKKNRFKP